jgi:recombination protein RecR
MKLSPLLSDLIDALRCLPGVGPKSAQRMAFHLLKKRAAGVALADVLQRAMKNMRHCTACRTYTESDLCPTCENPKRDHDLLCIVETPADIIAIEQSHTYKGLYFVLLGRLSPLDGIGPNELGLHDLQARLEKHPPREIIIATNSTIEGEASAHYIANMAHHANIPVSRIAHGVPMNGELEYIDSNTLSHAFAGRTRYEVEK